MFQMVTGSRFPKETLIRLELRKQKFLFTQREHQNRMKQSLTQHVFGIGQNCR